MRGGLQKLLFSCDWISQPLLCVDDVQVTSSRSGSTCGPHTSNPPGKPGVDWCTWALQSQEP